MTAPTRRLGRPGQPQLSPRTRAILGARRVAQRKPGRPPIGRALMVIALALVVGVGTITGVGVAVGASVINALAKGLPDPASLDSLTFSQPTIVYDRTGTIELA